MNTHWLLDPTTTEKTTSGVLETRQPARELGLGAGHCTEKAGYSLRAGPAKRPRDASGRGLSLAPPPPPATRVTWPARGSRDLFPTPPFWSSRWGKEKRGKRGKRAGREVGEDPGEGTARLPAGQRRLAEAAAAARPQVPRPGAAPPPAVSAAAGHVRPPLRPLPAPACSSAGRHATGARHMRQVPWLFSVPCAAYGKACGDPGLALQLGVGGTSRSPAWSAGRPAEASLPSHQQMWNRFRAAGMERTTVSSLHLLITFLNPQRSSPLAAVWCRKSWYIETVLVFYSYFEPLRWSDLPRDDWKKLPPSNTWELPEWMVCVWKAWMIN